MICRPIFKGEILMAKLTIQVGINFSIQPPEIGLQLHRDSAKLKEKFPELLSFDVAPGGTVTWESPNIPFAILFPLKNPFGDDNFMISEWNGVVHRIEKKVIVSVSVGRPKHFKFWIVVEDPNGNRIAPLESEIVADPISQNS
jgi:hypothetical protein